MCRSVNQDRALFDDRHPGAGDFPDDFGGERHALPVNIHPVLRFSLGPTWVPAAIAGLGVVGFCLVLRPSGQAVPRPAPPGPVVAPFHATPPGAANHVTFTFWNVEWFPGRRPHAGARAQATHVAAVLPVVQGLDPDVLGLEEVGDAEAARLLTDHLPGFKVDVCTEFTREPANEPSRQQIVLCSRLPLLTAGWQRWRPDAQGRLPAEEACAAAIVAHDAVQARLSEVEARLVAVETAPDPAPRVRRPRVVKSAETAEPTTGPEPEPVKWWLPSYKAKRGTH